MPFYTFKCPSCKKEKEVLQGMNDKPPTCSECSTILPRRYIDMERVLKQTQNQHQKMVRGVLERINQNDYYRLD